MRLVIATAAAGLGLVGLVGCGHTAPVNHAAADTVVMAAPAADVHDVQLAARNVTRDAAPVAPPAEPDDAVVHPPIAQPKCPGSPSVHFDTPEAAMTYLASAWNRNDLAALCQVTNPNARLLLNDMHREAVNLHLIKCNKVEVGGYQCTFRHDYPGKAGRRGMGRAWLDVAAARNPGWYMTVFQGCG